MEAEFPSWSLLSAFSVFDLDGKSSENRTAGPETRKSLKRLAQAFGVPNECLEREYMAVIAVAHALFKQGSCNRAAWKAAVERTTSTKRLKDKYGTSEALSKVLGAFIAWTASSSGVEQLFSKMKRSPVELASAKDDTDTRMAVVMGQDSMADQEVIFEAQRLYASFLKSGRARRRVVPRFDLGKKAVTPGKSKGSHAEFMRKRKAAVQAEALQTTPPSKRPRRELPESLEKESRRQCALQEKGKVEAFLDKLLLPEEITPDLRIQAASVAKKWANADKTRIEKVELRKALCDMQMSQCQALRGLQGPVHFYKVAQETSHKWLSELKKIGINRSTQAKISSLSPGFNSIKNSVQNHEYKIL